MADEAAHKSHWRVWAAVADVVSFIAKVSGFGAIIALAWLLYGLFGGYAANPANQQKLLTTALAFQICAVVLSLCVLLLTWETKDAAILLGVGGLALYLGMPMVVDLAFGVNAARAVTTIVRLKQAFLTAGGWALGLALLRYLVALIEGMRELPERWVARGQVGVATKATEKERLSGRPNAFSPCWKLPYCRGPIRKICPAFLARKRCWKFGRGCYCDQDMIEKIVMGESGARTATARAFVREAVTVGGEPQRQGKPPCGKCYIYLEHQKLKHKLLSPLVVPATLGLMYLVYPTLSGLYKVAAQFSSQVWRAISYTPVQAVQKKPDLSDFSYTIEMMVMVLVGFFALIYMTRLLEFCIYKLKW